MADIIGPDEDYPQIDINNPSADIAHGKPLEKYMCQWKPASEDMCRLINGAVVQFEWDSTSDNVSVRLVDIKK